MRDPRVVTGELSSHMEMSGKEDNRDEPPICQAGEKIRPFPEDSGGSASTFPFWYN